MKNLLTLLIISMPFLLGFIEIENKSTEKSYSFTRSENSDPLIVLNLKVDNTFNYKDYSNPKRSIEVEGKYRLNGNKVVLHSENSELSFAKVWHMDPDYPCIRTRKGLKFTRICEE